MKMPNLIDVTKSIDSANKLVASNALYLQVYANSVKQQPKFEFSDKFIRLLYADKGLKNTLVHADLFLNSILPMLIQNIGDISNYFAIHNAIAVHPSKGQTESQWIEKLSLLHSFASKYQQNASSAYKALDDFHSQLKIDSGVFEKVIYDTNNFVKGDNFILDDFKSQMNDYDAAYDFSAFDTAVSAGLFTVGFVILKIAKPYFLQFSPELIFLAIGLIGFFTATISSFSFAVRSLVHTLSLRDNLYKQMNKLRSDVKLAVSIGAVYKNFVVKSKGALRAANKMEIAWNYLNSDLLKLVNDLKNGITSSGQARVMFLSAAKTAIPQVVANVNTIKKQMAGVTIFVAKPSESMLDATNEPHSF